MTTSAQILAAILIVVVFLTGFSLCCLRIGQQLTNEQTRKIFSHRAFAAAPTSVTSAAPLTANDTNWAGYIVASDAQNPQATVTGISASWVVPTVVTSLQDEFSAIWIGIGGFFDNTLIQTGTEQDSIQGQSEYSVWYELLPQNSITIDTITVSPGDQMSASIQLVNSNTDEWTIDIKDLTTNQEYKNNVFYASSQLSAEWIVERPEISVRRSQGTLANLANIGNVILTNCHAGISGKSGSIGDFSTVVSLIMYGSVDNTSGSGVTQLTAVSDLTNNGSSFAVETSPLAVPEMSSWAVITLTTGTTLFVAVTKRKERREKLKSKR